MKSCVYFFKWFCIIFQFLDQIIWPQTNGMMGTLLCHFFWRDFVGDLPTYQPIHLQQWERISEEKPYYLHHYHHSIEHNIHFYKSEKVEYLELDLYLNPSQSFFMQNVCDLPRCLLLYFTLHVWHFLLEGQRLVDFCARYTAAIANNSDISPEEVRSAKGSPCNLLSSQFCQAIGCMAGSTHSFKQGWGQQCCTRYPLEMCEALKWWQFLYFKI